jgi:uncharacterized protein (DUF305 family)
MFSNQFRKQSGVALLAATVLLSPFALHAQASNRAMSGPSDAMHMAMMKGMDDMKSAPMTGDADKDFAAMMRMHHQQALEMANAELANGKSAEMKAMARKIIAAQMKEIAAFDKWLAAHK